MKTIIEEAKELRELSKVFQESQESLYKEMFSFENVTKMMGKINKAIYGINPYEKTDYEIDITRPLTSAEKEGLH